MVAWASALAVVSLRRTVIRAAAVLPFSLVAAIGLPFAGGGGEARILGVALSERGLWLLAGVAMKSFLSAAMLSVAVSSAGFDRILAAVRALGAPALFTDILALSWRYIFRLSEEAGKLERAAAARGFRPTWLPQAAVVGKLAGNLFLRSYERAERVHGAMLLRGYDGTLPNAPLRRPRIPEIAAAAVGMASIVAVRVLLA